MMTQLRAECRKLATVRSTYVLSIIAILLASFAAFWVMGYKGNPANPQLIMDAVSNIAPAITLFMAIVGILLVAHEYRYNTIMYTLTASNSRTNVLFAKVLMVIGFALMLSIFTLLLSALLTWIGASLKPQIMAAQEFYYWDTIWRTLFYCVAYTLAAMLLAVLLRNVVGAIVVLFVVPTIEGLLSILLKTNSKYLPFTSLEQVNSGSLMNPGKAALLFSLYLVAGWLIAWFLFVRRDAN